MARLKIDNMHKIITTKLLQDVEEDHISCSNEKTYKLSPENFDTLKKLKYKSEYIVDNDTIAVHFVLDDSNYILITGDFSLENPLDDEHDEPFLFSAIANSKKINKKKDTNSHEITNILDVDENEIEFYRIKGFFPSFSVTKYPQTISENPDNILYDFVLSTILKNKYHNLSFNQEITTTLSDILNVTNKRALPYENFINAYLEHSWKFSYLCLYRCLEPFYSIVWVDKMNTVFQNRDENYCKYTNEIAEYSRKVKNETEIFNIMTEHYSDNETKDLYSLRNSIVHNKLEEMTKSIKFDNFTDDDWNKYISAILNLIKNLYSKYTKEYINLCENYL